MIQSDRFSYKTKSEMRVNEMAGRCLPADLAVTTQVPCRRPRFLVDFPATCRYERFSGRDVKHIEQLVY